MFTQHNKIYTNKDTCFSQAEAYLENAIINNGIFVNVVEYLLHFLVTNAA